MGLFSSHLTGIEKESAVLFIRHLQTVLVYQQLSMEIYNDAAYSILGKPQNGAEVFFRPTGTFWDPALVEERLIPALKRKIQIIHLMETIHQQVKPLSSGVKREPYDLMTAYIRACLDRANLQYDSYSNWITNPQLDVDAKKLDNFELAALDRAVISLNCLIKKSGITNDEWLDIINDAFNSVRASIGLAPMNKNTFRSRYMRGLKGELIRFFSD
jgi:hypothetical protein